MLEIVKNTIEILFYLGMLVIFILMMKKFDYLVNETVSYLRNNQARSCEKLSASAFKEDSMVYNNKQHVAPLPPDLLAPAIKSPPRMSGGFGKVEKNG